MFDKWLQMYLNKLDKGEKLNECQIGDMRQDGKIIKEIIIKKYRHCQQMMSIVEINNRYFRIYWNCLDDDEEFDDYPYQPEELNEDEIQTSTGELS